MAKNKNQILLSHHQGIPKLTQNLMSANLNLKKVETLIGSSQKCQAFTIWPGRVVFENFQNKDLMLQVTFLFGDILKKQMIKLIRLS